MKIISLSEISPESKKGFLERFVSAPQVLREDPWKAYSPSAVYTQTALHMATLRKHEAFLCEEGGVLLGRCGITVNPDGKEAALGFFEVKLGTLEQKTTHELIQVAETWAKAQGCSRIYGPLDVNTWFSYRFLAQPDENARSVYSWEPVQPPVYIDLFKREGFEIAEGYSTRGIDFSPIDASHRNGFVEQMKKARTYAETKGVSFEHVDTSQKMEKVLGEVAGLNDRAFRENLLFESIPAELFKKFYIAVTQGKDTSYTWVARTSSGELVGFLFGFVDSGLVINKTVAVDPAFRGLHVSSALVGFLVERAFENQKFHLVSALVRSGNKSEFLSLNHIPPAVKSWKHDYVLLKKDLA